MQNAPYVTWRLPGAFQQNTARQRCCCQIRYLKYTAGYRSGKRNVESAGGKVLSMLRISAKKPLSSTADPQLSNGVREAMLQTGHCRGLVVVEGLYALKIKPDSWLTFAEIYRLLSENYSTSYQLTYKGLQDSNIFQRRIKPVSANQPGRRPYLYRVPCPDELVAEFAPDQHNTPHDQLHRDDFKSVTSYRKALHRQLYIRRWCENGGKGFVMYRGLMAERLGVSERTVRTYDRQLGFSHEANYQEERIHWGNWEKLPRFKDKYSPTGTRLPSKSWLKVIDWNNEGKTTLFPLVKYLAFNALRQGLDVYKLTRLPNTYYPYQKPDLSPFESWDGYLHYFAELGARNAAGLYRGQDGAWYHQRE